MTEPGTTPAESGANTDEESRLLLRFVRDQRAAVLKIIEGLAEDAWHKPVPPSEWTVAGMIWHLAGMEHHWREVIMGVRDEQPEADLPEDYEEGEWDPLAPFTCELPGSVITAVYQAECQRTDEILSVIPLAAAPPGLEFHHDTAYTSQISTVRFIVLHIIEETAAHSGHLEIVRELLDGRTGLAGR
jgi:uncharacterized damage-inducible protein DinB